MMAPPHMKRAAFLLWVFVVRFCFAFLLCVSVVSTCAITGGQTASVIVGEAGKAAVLDLTPGGAVAWKTSLGSERRSWDVQVGVAVCGNTQIHSSFFVKHPKHLSS